MGIQKLTLIWNNIAVEISYNEDYSKAFREAYGYRLVHLEVQSSDNQALPISMTGYRSLFTPAPSIDEYGSSSRFNACYGFDFADD